MTLRSLISAGALITVGMFVGRLLGLLREMLLAAHFATGPEANTAIALLLIPDFIASALIGSAASAVLVPAFAQRNEADAQALLWQALWISIAAMTALTLLVSLKLTEFHIAYLLALCSLPLTAATAVITAWLQHKERFTAPAFANTAFNAVVIAALWFWPTSVVGLGIAIVAAAAFRLIIHVIPLVRTRSKNAALSSWQLHKPMLMAYVSAVGSGIFGILPYYIPYVILALAGVGIAVFNYAFKLMLFPAVLGQTLVQLALLPWLVRRLRDNPSESPTHSCLVIAWIISLALSLSLSLAGYAIASLFFGHGAMTEDDVRAVANAFSTGIWATPFLLLTTIWQQTFFAQQSTRPVLIASTFQAGATLFLCWLGFQLLADQGVLYGYIAAQALVLMVFALQAKRIGWISYILPPPIYLVATLVMVCMFAPFVWFFPALAPIPTIAFCMLAGMVCLAAGLWMYVPARRLLFSEIRQRT
jgi:putative peptidoglycan lipid II flippase